MGEGSTGMGAAHHWYALNTKPNKERQVAAVLRQSLPEVYLPLVQVNPVNPRSARERPLFPGYLFTRLDLHVVDLAGLQWTPGLRSFVQFGDEPATIADHYMAEMKRRISRIQALGGQVFDGLEPGALVKIVAGPFAEYEAIFDLRLKGTERVRVLLRFLESQTRKRSAQYRYLPLEINAGSITKVKPKKS